MTAVHKNVEFRKTERNPDLSGNHNGEDWQKMLSSVHLTLRQALGERICRSSSQRHFYIHPGCLAPACRDEIPIHRGFVCPSRTQHDKLCIVFASSDRVGTKQPLQYNLITPPRIYIVKSHSCPSKRSGRTEIVLPLSNTKSPLKPSF